jgi:hypothetical protein
MPVLYGFDTSTCSISILRFDKFELLQAVGTPMNYVSVMSLLSLPPYQAAVLSNCRIVLSPKLAEPPIASIDISSFVFAYSLFCELVALLGPILYCIEIEWSLGSSFYQPLITFIILLAASIRY